MEQVILVDEHDNAIGTMEKLEAHQKGVLHRAFSVLLFNDEGQLLLQKRSNEKYHSAGLWTNTCCSHPLPGERIEDATTRRLREEMGIDAQTKFAYKFIYKTALDKQLIEHEFDHVFIGLFNGTPAINKNEVADWKFVDKEWLQNDIDKHPEQYTVWFRLIMNQMSDSLISY
jgi:isopentenyl-diphosphate Delta-isomerase